MLDAAGRYALQSLPFPHGHLALFTVLCHGLYFAPNFGHVFRLRLLVVVQLRSRLREAIGNLWARPTRWRAVEVAEFALDGRQLLTEKELLLLL